MASGYCRCLRLSDSPSFHPSVTKFVRAITHYPFKLGTPNLDHRCKRPCLRTSLFCGGDWPWPSRSNLTSKSKFNPFWVVHMITHHPFKLGPPNLNQRYKIPWLRSLLFWGAIDLHLQGQIWLNKSNFLVSPLLEIYNHHIHDITTREPGVPRLLHRRDCFMVSILCTYLYTKTVSRSWLFHSLDTLHVYWSRQRRVFWRLPSLLLIIY